MVNVDRRNVLGFLALAAVAIQGAGCLGLGTADQSTLNLQSDLARDVWSLYSLITWITCIIGGVVFALLAYILVKFREKPGDTTLPEQVHGNLTMELGWTVLPVIITLIILVPTIQTVFKIGAPPPEGAIHIQAIGHQWWWEFRYQDMDKLVVANEVHIPAGKPVNFEIMSADVLHSFWAPQFGGKRDAVPTRAQNMWFTADKPGFYVGQCAEYCGDSHALMELRVQVDSAADFDAWVKAQQAPQPESVVGGTLPGPSAFLNGGCIACHTVRGNPVAMGKLGPDLTHLASRKTFGSGIYEVANAEHLKKWLEDPQAAKPGSKMILPRKLTPEEINTLVPYLQGLK